MDGPVHHQVLNSFVQRGHAPSVDELVRALASDVASVEAALRRLHDQHALVLQPGSCEVWLAHPFSSSPTPVWVAQGERGWWAPCMWCAAGIVALVAPSATIHARYGGEVEPALFTMGDGNAQGEEPLIHFAIPPREAWNNVLHFCATVLPFRSARDVDAWSARHRLPRGAVVPWPQVLALGRAWYGRHLDPDFRKWTVTEARAIFAQVGLRDPFWQLPASDERF